jgi:hypothetical protein
MLDLLNSFAVHTFVQRLLFLQRNLLVQFQVSSVFVDFIVF